MALGNLGHYELLQELGRGPIGTVFKARHRESERIVAVKVLSPFITGQGYGYARPFVERAKAIAKLRHPNIVLESQVGVAEGKYFVAREYVAGRSLMQLLSEEGRLPEPEVIRLGIEVATALKVTQEIEVAHRHLKPSNVLLGDDASVKVSDFSMAKIDRRSARITDTGDIAEATYYVAPERPRSERDAAIADIYSLGAILYHMVTGRPPFGGETPEAIAYKKKKSDPPSPAAFTPSVSQKLERLILKSLSRSRKRRYGAAEEVLNALKEAAKAGATTRRSEEPLGLNAVLEIMRGKHGGHQILIDRQQRYSLEVRVKGDVKRFGTLVNDGSRLYLHAVSGMDVRVNGERIEGCEIQSGDILTLRSVQLRCGLLPRSKDAIDIVELAAKKGLLKDNDRYVVLDEVIRREAEGGAVTAGKIMLDKGLVALEKLSQLRTEFDQALRAEASGEGKPSLALVGGDVGNVSLRADGKVVMEVGSLTVGEEILSVARKGSTRRGAARGLGVMGNLIFCSRCEELVPEEDIIKGIATQVRGKTYCRRCSAVDRVVGSILMTDKFRSSYRVEGLLGKGTLGKVYRATQLRTGDVVALKIIPDRKGENRLAVERLEAFMVSALALKHPNLVAVMPIELTQEEALLPMRFAGERTAADILPKRPLSLDKQDDLNYLQGAVDLVFQVASALGVVHRGTIVHGEIRPDKIFIGEDGVVRLSDAGLPTALIMRAEGGQLRLSARMKRFTAPEILSEGEINNCRSDIYSLGLVLCTLITGSELLKKHMPGGGEPEGLQEALLQGQGVPEKLPARLIKLLCRMINFAPENRYPRVGNVMRELVAVQKELGG